VFGTIVQVEIAATDAARAAAAFDALDALFRELDVEWRSFGPGELGRVNDLLAAGEPADLSPRLSHLVERSLEIRERTDGLFDPRVGPLVALWGFQDMASRDPAGPPTEALVSETRVASIERASLHLAGNRLWSEGPVRLDLAGIAKGSALAAGAELLRAAGAGSALIVAGGDIIAIGDRGGRPWRVGVRNPLQQGVLGTVALAAGEAAVSSGNYERRYESRGERFHHIIDPRTGRPARGAAGTTVLSRDVELANAAATALMVGGPERFTELTDKLGIECALLAAEDGRLLMTPCMQRRLERP
jgi:thiamine biosynthesis lipoprotein